VEGQPVSDRNSTEIRRALEKALSWNRFNEGDLSETLRQQKTRDVAKAEAILCHWRDQEAAEGQK